MATKHNNNQKMCKRETIALKEKRKIEKKLTKMRKQ